MPPHSLGIVLGERICFIHNELLSLLVSMMIIQDCKKFAPSISCCYPSGIFFKCSKSYHIKT